MLVLGLGAASHALTVMAQTLPDKPIRVIVPVVAGASMDARMRTIGSALTQQLKRQVIIENKPGAGGSLGAAFVAQSAPDGMTLLFTNNSFAINPFVYKNAGYDPLKSFVPVNRAYVAPLVVVIGAQVQANSLQELVALAKVRPESLNYGSSGQGSVPHFATESFFRLTGISLLHIPFKGDVQALIEVLGGRVSLVFSGVLAAQPHIKSGKLRALAVTSAQRIAALDNVPTLREAGYPTYDDTIWAGFFAPAATPKGVVEFLNREISTALSSPALRARLDATGAEVATLSLAQYAVFIQGELARYAKLVKELGVGLE